MLTDEPYLVRTVSLQSDVSVFSTALTCLILNYGEVFIVPSACRSFIGTALSVGCAEECIGRSAHLRSDFMLLSLHIMFIPRHFIF